MPTHKYDPSDSSDSSFATSFVRMGNSKRHKGENKRGRKRTKSDFIRSSNSPRMQAKILSEDQG